MKFVLKCADWEVDCETLDEARRAHAEIEHQGTCPLPHRIVTRDPSGGEGQRRSHNPIVIAAAAVTVLLLTFAGYAAPPWPHEYRIVVQRAEEPTDDGPTPSPAAPIDDPSAGHGPRPPSGESTAVGPARPTGATPGPAVAVSPPSNGSAEAACESPTVRSTEGRVLPMAEVLCAP